MKKKSYKDPAEFLKELQTFHRNEPAIKGEGHEEFSRNKKRKTVF